MLGCEMTTSNLEAREISIAGRHLRCQVCEFTRFHRREAELASGASFFGQEWANPKADCYVCEQCGFVHWFVRTRSVAASAANTELSEEIEELRQRLEAAYAEELETSRA